MSTNRIFAGISEVFGVLENSKIVLIPVPYDDTSTWRKGSSRGPNAFIKASEYVELYDIETRSEVYRHGIHLTDPLSDFNTPEEMVTLVHKTVKNYIKRNKFTTLIGGEHSISIGAIRAFNECFDNLTVLQLDAHADLRKEYNGSPFNHACALYEANENTNLIQVGIRSMDQSETLVMKNDNVFFAHDMANSDYWMDDAIDLMTDNVYITFDLDAFDPSIFPATGTPEPGGLFWYETLEFLRRVFSERNVVGFDLVELCPHSEDKSSDFLAAKLYYKMLCYCFEEEEEISEEEEDTKADFLHTLRDHFDEYDER